VRSVVSFTSKLTPHCCPAQCVDGVRRSNGNHGDAIDRRAVSAARPALRDRLIPYVARQLFRSNISTTIIARSRRGYWIAMFYCFPSECDALSAVVAHLCEYSLSLQNDKFTMYSFLSLLSNILTSK